MIVFACVMLTLGLFYYIFLMQGETSAGEEKSRLAFLRERKDVLYDSLRDLNFEFRSGKFPAHDYEDMRNTLEREAAAVLAEIDDLERRAAVS